MNGLPARRRTHLMWHAQSSERSCSRSRWASLAGPSDTFSTLTAPTIRSPSEVRMLLYRRARSSELGSLTKVPCPCRRVSRRSASRSLSALRAVPGLTPNSRARSASLGRAAPGFHTPVAMRAAKTSRICWWMARMENRLVGMGARPRGLWLGFLPDIAVPAKHRILQIENIGKSAHRATTPLFSEQLPIAMTYADRGWLLHGFGIGRINGKGPG